MSYKRQGKKRKRGCAPQKERMTKRRAAKDLPRISDIDFNSPAERDAYIKELQRQAGENIHAAVRKLKDLGVIDEKGKRVRKELPPDMQPGSRCQLPK